MTIEERLAELEARVKDLEFWNYHGQEECPQTKWDKKQKEECK